MRPERFRLSQPPTPIHDWLPVWQSFGQVHNNWFFMKYDFAVVSLRNFNGFVRTIHITNHYFVECFDGLEYPLQKFFRV